MVFDGTYVLVESENFDEYLKAVGKGNIYFS